MIYYYGLLFGSIGVSIFGIVLAISTAEPHWGSRFASWGVAASFGFLFYDRNRLRNLHELIDEASIQIETITSIIDDSNQSHPEWIQRIFLEVDILKGRVVNINNRINSETDDSYKKNCFIAVSAIFSTLLCGFGDWISTLFIN